MLVCQKNMDAYKAQQQGYGHRVTIYYVQKSEERGKSTWGKSSLKIGKGTKFEICLQNIFIFTLMS